MTSLSTAIDQAQATQLNGSMLKAKQKKILNGFSYEFTDDRSRKIGEINWPDAAVATNARFKKLIPKFLNTKFEMDFRGQKFLIQFEYLNRAWENNIQFFLTERDQQIAIAEVLQKKWSRPEIRIKAPFQGKLVRNGGIFSANYTVYEEEKVIGSIYPKKGFSFKREICIDLPDKLDTPIMGFLFFLMVNHAYR